MPGTVHPPAPLPPDLSEGNCATGAAGLPPQAWDADASADAREVAIEACSWCPALSPCAKWRASLPSARRPVGVVAGLFRGYRRDSTAAPAGLATATANDAPGMARAGLATVAATAGGPVAGEDRRARRRQTHRRYRARHQAASGTGTALPAAIVVGAGVKP